MRDRETVDSELRLVDDVRRAVRYEGRPMPITAPMDELLDQRLAHPGWSGQDAAVDT